MKKKNDMTEKLQKKISALEKENKELKKKIRQNYFVFPKIKEITLSDGTTEKFS